MNIVENSTENRCLATSRVSFTPRVKLLLGEDENNKKYRWNIVSWYHLAKTADVELMPITSYFNFAKVSLCLVKSGFRQPDPMGSEYSRVTKTYIKTQFHVVGAIFERPAVSSVGARQVAIGLNKLALTLQTTQHLNFLYNKLDVAWVLVCWFLKRQDGTFKRPDINLLQEIIRWYFLFRRNIALNTYALTEKFLNHDNVKE